MATRSAIAIKHGDRIKAVYCHWDGYPEHNGFILENFYNDSVSVNKLVSMGDISALGASIGEKHEFHSETQYADIPDCLTAVGTQCTFYNRDRGENTQFKSFASTDEFVEYYDGCGSEYFYLYDNGVWFVSAYKKPFQSLSHTLATLKETV